MLSVIEKKTRKLLKGTFIYDSVQGLNKFDYCQGTDLSVICRVHDYTDNVLKL